MPRSGSRSVIGSGRAPLLIEELPQVDEVDLGLEGRLAAERMPISVVSSGMLFVVSVWRPGPKMSSALPSRKKTAAWLSRTMSCEPMRKSPDHLGDAMTISFPVSSKSR